MAKNDPPSPDYNIYADEEELRRRHEKSLRLIAADVEAQKHEIWACKIGDQLELIAPLDVTAEPDESVIEHMEPVGQLYRVAGRVARGWDLERQSGDGPEFIRMMNWNVLTYFKVAKRVDSGDSPQRPG